MRIAYLHAIRKRPLFPFSIGRGRPFYLTSLRNRHSEVPPNIIKLSVKAGLFGLAIIFCCFMNYLVFWS